MHAPEQFTAEKIERARHYAAATPPADLDPRVGALINELSGRVADKWTMLILEVLGEHGELRFTRLSDLVSGMSKSLLTQTLQHMERDGLLVRTVHPVVPPKVEYRLTGLGLSLGAAFCGVWVWAAENLDEVERARQAFSKPTGRKLTITAPSLSDRGLHRGTLTAATCPEYTFDSPGNASRTAGRRDTARALRSVRQGWFSGQLPLQQPAAVQALSRCRCSRNASLKSGC